MYLNKIIYNERKTFTEERLMVKEIKLRKFNNERRLAFVFFFFFVTNGPIMN